MNAAETVGAAASAETSFAAAPETAPAAPAPLATPAPAPGLDPERILYPSGTRPASGDTGPATSGGVGPVWVFALLVGLGAAALWAWRRRQTGSGLRRGASIVIEDTRALGNRQFLVVAGVDGRRFLLGVAPGSIRLLSPLDDASDSEPAEGAVQP